MPNRNRSSKKRQRATELSDVAVMDESSNRLLLQMERAETTASDVAETATQQTAAEAMRTMLTLRRVQCHLLQTYSRLLAKCSKSLTESGCWQFLELHRKEATRAGVFEDLEHLTFQSAAEFADKRMAKLSRKYSKEK